MNRILNLFRNLPLLYKQAILLIVAVTAISSTTFVVDERERVVVTRLGNPVSDITEAGLYFKRPFVDTVHSRDKRLYVYDSEPKSVPTSDSKLLVVDLFGFLYIKDGIRFFQKVDNIPAALLRVETVLYSELRDVVGNHRLEELVGGDRDKFMEDVTKRAGKSLDEFGIGIKIALSSRTDLPSQNKKSVYERMNAERNRVAVKNRAEGEAQKVRIMAEADRDYVIVVSEAKALAEKTRGEGDAQATKIFNDAFGKDPEFFRLYRGIEAAKLSLGGAGDTRLILSGREPHLQSLFGSDSQKK